MGDLLTLAYPTRGAREVLDAQARRLPWRWGIFMDTAAGIHLEELQKRTPKGRGQKPGRLLRGWRKRREGTGASARHRIYNVEAHLRHVIRGRRAIDQRARGVPYPLHFWIDGREFYRWRVGAAPANPFHILARRAARPRIRAAMRGTVRDIIAVRNTNDF